MPLSKSPGPTSYSPNYFATRENAPRPTIGNLPRISLSNLNGVPGPGNYQINSARNPVFASGP